MSDEDRLGKCLCGGVAVRIPRSRREVGVCHCDTCRRWTSGPWMAIQAPEARIEGDTLQVFQSSAFAERGFCAKCGSVIFHRPQDGPECAVSAGLFDPRELELGFEICIDKKPEFYGFTPAPRRLSTVRLGLEWAPKLIGRRLKRLLTKAT